MVWTVFPHLHHFLGKQRKPSGLKLKLTDLFKYTVINHVTGVSPSTVGYCLGSWGGHKVLDVSRVHVYDNEKTHKHMITHAHIIGCQGLLQVGD